MTESQKKFLLWFKTTNQTLEMKDWSNICYQAAWNHQKKRIDKLEKKLAIAVNALKLYSANKRIGLNATIALKQIEVK